MLNFGPPSNTNTMTNKQHHKPDKKSARRTQRRPKTFDMDTCLKIEDHRLVELAMAEVEENRTRWQYPRGFSEPRETGTPTPMRGQKKRDPIFPRAGGTSAEFSYDQEEKKWSYSVMNTEMNEVEKFTYPKEVFRFICELGDRVRQWLPQFDVHTECQPTKGGVTYRACPIFMGRPWYDWALFRYDVKFARALNEPLPPLGPLPAEFPHAYIDDEDGQVKASMEEAKVRPAHIRPLWTSRSSLLLLIITLAFALGGYDQPFMPLWSQWSETPTSLSSKHPQISSSPTSKRWNEFRDQEQITESSWS